MYMQGGLVTYVLISDANIPFFKTSLAKFIDEQMAIFCQMEAIGEVKLDSDLILLFIVQCL